MIKVMVFIDGTWVYASTPHLREVYGQTNFEVDYGKLPTVLAEELSTRLRDRDVDVVRTFLFGSYPENYDLQDEDAVQSRLNFFSRLKEDHHY